VIRCNFYYQMLTHTVSSKTRMANGFVVVLDRGYLVSTTALLDDWDL